MDLQRGSERITICPECQSSMNTYYIDGWIEQICWNCGYYESNSPAYREYPEMFKDIVGKNPSYFMKKFLKITPSDEFSQQKKSDDKYTAPGFAYVLLS